MTKLDLKKTLPSYLAKHNEFSIIEVPPIQYIMMDGHGDPNTSQEFKDALATLYPIAYKIKFASKKKLEKDFVVMPLEALWWAEDMENFTTTPDKSKWDFTVMIMQPDWITKGMFENAVNEVAKKNPALKLDAVRLETLHEGKCVQTLHIGSFDNEGAILEEMHSSFIPSNGLKMIQKHHEIYLSDFRKVPAEKLRTILRQPVG